MKRVKRASSTFCLGLLMTLLAVSPSGPVYGERSAHPELETLQAPITNWIRITENSELDLGGKVAYNSVRHEFLVVWPHGGEGGSCYGQRISPARTLIGGAFVIAPSCLDVAYDPSSDRYLVVGSWYNSETSSYDLSAQLVEGDGTVSVLPNLVDNSEGYLGPAAVTYNSQDHEYLVVYGSGDDYNVLGRLVGANGVPIGPGPTPIAGPWYGGPDVAYNEARNRYLVVYQSLYGATTADDIYARWLTNTLNMPQKQVGVCVDSTYEQSSLAVAAGPDEYLVVWGDERPADGTFLSVYGRRLVGDGIPVGPAGGFFVGRNTKEAHRAFPAVAYWPGFAYLAVWAYAPNYGDDYSWNTYGAYILPGTDALTGSPFDIDATLGYQNNAAVACAPRGVCLMTESDYFYDPAELSGWFIEAIRRFMPLALTP